MKKNIYLVFLLSLFVLFACKDENKKTNSSTNKVFKIGGLGPTSGGAAVYGQSTQRGSEIAVEEINNNGGINGYKIEFKFADDEHDVEKVVNAYNSLKDWGMQILVGGTTSAPTIAISNKTFKDNVFQITPAGSAVDCTKHPNVFRMCFNDPNQGIASAQYVDSHKLAKKVGIIYDSSDVYSSGIYEKFMEESNGKNYEVVAVEPFTSESKTDFTTQLNKMKFAGAELVFLPFYYSEASLVLTQANAMGYKPIFFSADGMDGILSLEGFNKSLAEGVILITPFSADDTDSRVVKFVSTYKNKYGEIPNQFAADGYDSVYAIKYAIEKANVNPSMSITEINSKLQSAMTQIKMDGLTGKNITWTQNGEPNKDTKAVVIKNSKYVLMK